MLSCCGATEHAWDRYEVEHHWIPRVLRCLIIGENPGGNSSEYFYARPTSYTNDPVVVRRSLLRGLHNHGFIPEATLEGFKDAGFLFDHAIRCQLASAIVGRERQRAMRYRSRRVEDASHLRPLVAKATVVWVMGHLASNAVANATAEFAKERRKISEPPHPAAIGPCSRFFLSEYFTWRNEGDTPGICAAFARFASGKVLFRDV